MLERDIEQVSAGAVVAENVVTSIILLSATGTESNGRIFYVVHQGKQSSSFPVALVIVNGDKCRALLDTGSGSAYLSSSLINWTRMISKPTEQRSIEMLVSASTRK